MIKLHHITATYNTTPVLNNLSLQLSQGELTAIIGPNGAGKSSLLRAITGALPLQSGTITLNNTPLPNLTPRQRAQLMAVVPQHIPLHTPYTAAEFVMLGRTPLLPRLGAPTPADHHAVTHAMKLTTTTHLRHRLLSQMSGGERQRTALAMALAANPKLLLLDEPTSHLDLKHRTEIMSLLLKLNQHHNVTILMVVHDLTLASQYFPRLALISQGKIVADGSPTSVITTTNLHQHFNVTATITPLPPSPALSILPHPKPSSP